MRLTNTVKAALTHLAVLENESNRAYKRFGVESNSYNRALNDWSAGLAMFQATFGVDLLKDKAGNNAYKFYLDTRLAMRKED